jgi:protein-disulfide isomerase
MKLGRTRETDRQKTRIWIGAGATLFLVAALALVGVVSSDKHAADPAAQQATSHGSDGNSPFAHVARRAPNDPLALGRVDAPVVLVEWSEFQCPFCGQFARNTQPELVKKYVDSGKVRVEWRDFPYLGPESTTAAHAGRAAAAQGKFWAYHDALYSAQHKVNSGALTEEYLTQLAGTLGMDTTRFRSDMNNPAVAQAVQADLQQGIDLGISGTPAFLVGETPIMGAESTGTFEKAIDDALAKAR